MFRLIVAATTGAMAVMGGAAHIEEQDGSTVSSLRGAAAAVSLVEEGKKHSHRHHGSHHHHGRHRHHHHHHPLLHSRNTEHASSGQAGSSVRFKERVHKHHHAQREALNHKSSPKLDAFYAAHTSLLQVSASSADTPMLSSNGAQQPQIAQQAASGDDDDAAALAQLTRAAGTIEMRFKKAESDKQFGQGLDKQLVDTVKADSETFWDDVRGLSAADTAGLSESDAKDLQKVVQQVAQMDDDLDDPKRTAQVAGEYDTIRSELKDVDI